MSDAVIWSLVVSALAVVAVRRRSVAIALVAAQSVILGTSAIADAAGESTALAVAGAALLAKAVVLPILLLSVVTRTRETRWIQERHPLARLTIALAVALALAALVPRFGLESAAAEHAAVGLLALGITTAVVRGAAIFAALGFLVAENGLYLAALAAPGGVPAFIELGLVFDLVVIVSVAGAFSAKIHEELGTGDTTLLGALRD
jgi:hydrogenase-4 component E